MAIERETLTTSVNTMLEGVQSLVSTKTVIGEAQVLGDVTIVPLIDVSFGMGAGTFHGERKDRTGGGVGAKISPSAVLVIAKDGTTRLIRTDDKEDVFTRIVDMAPSLINRFTSKKKSGVEAMTDSEVEELKDTAKKVAEDTAKLILAGEK